MKRIFPVLVYFLLVNWTANAQLAAGVYVTNIKCADSCTGTAVMNVTGGVPPYYYNWSNLILVKYVMDKKVYQNLLFR